MLKKSRISLAFLVSLIFINLSHCKPWKPAAQMVHDVKPFYIRIPTYGEMSSHNYYDENPDYLQSYRFHNFQEMLAQDASSSSLYPYHRSRNQSGLSSVTGAIYPDNLDEIDFSRQRYFSQYAKDDYFVTKN